MLECKISSAANQRKGAADSVEMFLATFGQLTRFASTDDAPGAAQHADVGASLALRYAGSTPIVKRRIDALMREAQTMGTTGMRLIAGRRANADAATLAAARFLGTSLDMILRKVEATLSPRTA